MSLNRYHLNPSLFSPSLHVRQFRQKCKYGVSMNFFKSKCMCYMTMQNSRAAEITLLIVKQQLSKFMFLFMQSPELTSSSPVFSWDCVIWCHVTLINFQDQTNRVNFQTPLLLVVQTSHLFICSSLSTYEISPTSEPQIYIFHRA